MSTTTVNLAEFCPTHVFVVSAGAPTGVTYDMRLGDPTDEPNMGFDTLDINGTLDAEGVFHWDGEGDPTDCRRNTVQRIDAWIDNDAPIED